MLAYFNNRYSRKYLSTSQILKQVRLYPLRQFVFMYLVPALAVWLLIVFAESVHEILLNFCGRKRCFFRESWAVATKKLCDRFCW